MSTMKAVRVSSVGDPSVLKVEEVAIPQPGPGELLVKVMAAGVNPVETYMRSGNYARLPELPYTPGRDGAGVVEQIGEGVTQHAVGDRVYLTKSTHGTYAQFCLCTETEARRLPAAVSFEQGASINVAYRTAYRALFQRARVIPGQKVLVHGATGGVGVAAVQLAMARGLEVIGTAGTEAGKKALNSIGLQKVYMHTEEGYMDEIFKATGGVDAIIEMLANVNLAKDLEILAHGGVVAVVGNRGSIEINPRLLMQKESSVIGVMAAEGSEEAYAAIDAGLEHYIRPLIGQTFALAEAPQSHIAVLEGGHTGKIVIQPWKE